MRYSSDFIDQVQGVSDLVELVSQYSVLRPVGNNMMGRCPFPDHQEKTPSFSVSPGKQVYYCFGCQKKGNVFTFLREIQGLNFVEALEFLAKRANLALPEPSDAAEAAEDKILRQKRKRATEAHVLAAQFYHRNLMELPRTHSIWKYIESRGLQEDMVREFQLGWAPDSWNDLFAFLSQRSFRPEELEEAKLIKITAEGKAFDLFRKRWMFPIFDSLGDCVGFGGRVLPGEGEPKYLNSPESPVFHKGKLLFGLNKAAKYIRSEEFVLVVEGYMDVVGLFQAGIYNVVASLGTSLTAEHIRQLKRQSPSILLLFDGDEAGQNAAERSLPLFLESGLVPRALVLPEGQDPDEFVKQYGKEAFRALLESASDLYTLSLKKWLAGYRGEVSEKLSLLDRLQKLFRGVQDPRILSLCLEETSRRLGMTLSQLKSEIKISKDGLNSPTRSGLNSVSLAKAPGPNEVRILAEGTRGSGAGPDLIEFRIEGASRLELLVLKLILKKEQFLQMALAYGLEEDLSSWAKEGVRKILSWIKTKYGQSPTQFDRFLSLLSLRVDKPEYLIDDLGTEDEEKLLADVLRKIRVHRLQKLSDQVALQAKSSSDPQALQQLLEIQKIKRQLLKEGL